MYNGFHAIQDYSGKALRPMESIAYFNSDGTYKMKMNHFIVHENTAENNLHNFNSVKPTVLLVSEFNLGDTVVFMYKYALTKAIINEMSGKEAKVIVNDINGRFFIPLIDLENCFKIKDGKKSRCVFLKENK